MLISFLSKTKPVRLYLHMYLQIYSACSVFRLRSYSLHKRRRRIRELRVLCYIHFLVFFLYLLRFEF